MVTRRPTTHAPIDPPAVLDVGRVALYDRRRVDHPHPKGNSPTQGHDPAAVQERLACAPVVVPDPALMRPALEDGDGILPSQWIRSAIEQGYISAPVAISPRQIQPNSLDLRLGTHGYRVQCSFLPGKESARQKLQRFKWYDVPIVEGGVVLERNQVYLFPLWERLDLPAHVSARANPKSSTGRLDIFTRLVTENGTAFDEVPRGYTGELYLEVVPRSFAIRVRPGDSLSQARFHLGDPRLSDQEIATFIDTADIILDPHFHPLRARDLRISSGIFLSVNLAGRPDSTIGYRAKKNTPPIDLRAIGGARVRHYWERIFWRPSSPIILEPDEFYIFASRELVRLPPDVCAEMVPFDASSGELRTHYAGFFDSGFGYESNPGLPPKGAAVVLEVRNRDVPFMIEDGHPLFRLLFLRNSEQPDILYGGGVGSNYQHQRLRLGKQFGADSEKQSSDSEAAEEEDAESTKRQGRFQF